MTIETKTPSSKFYKLLDMIVENEKSTKESFEEAVEVARKQGFTDTEIAMFMHDYLRDKIPKTTLGRWLKPLQPELEQSTSQSDPVDQNDDKNDTEQEEATVTVTTDGSQTTNWDEEIADLGINKDVPVKDSEQFYTEQKGEPEEPTELELANIRIAQLEDALHKTEQFKPATQLQVGTGGFKIDDDNLLFDTLSKRENGINCYWFPNYGIELFRNRILTDLKGRGVKVFKRLYFEV